MLLFPVQVEKHVGTISLVAMLSLGFFLGMRHATDADHVVAVSTIVSRERRISTAAWIGVLWGAGHTITIFAVGTGIILFALTIPPRIGLSMEFSVGLMLVFLGFVNLRGFGEAVGRASHIYMTQSEKDGVHVEPHTHDVVTASVDLMDHRFGGWGAYRWARPLVVGLVHGLAGSAAVALLVLTTLHDSRWAVVYLLVFGAGTIAGMMVITVMMASALKLAGDRSAWINKRLAIATGVLSVAFGLFVVYQMGIVHGLFTAHPTWTPE
jgi:hypothetical protein